MSQAIRNLNGMTFGKLTVISLLPQRCKKGGAVWLVRCQCGATRSVRSADLVRAKPKSCAPACTGMGSRWKPEEIGALRDLYGTMPIGKLCAFLGRPRWAVYWRACKMGLTLGQSDGKESLRQAADRLGHSRAWLRSRLRRAGIQVQPYMRLNPADVDLVFAAGGFKVGSAKPGS